MFILPEEYNVLLTFSPIKEITGHWFEVFEYYWYLKEHNLKPYMLFHSPGLSFEDVYSALKDKYSVDIPKKDLYVLSKVEKLIAAPLAVALVCDGNFSALREQGVKIIAKKIFGFGCGDVSIPYGDYKDAEYLLDKRVYDVSYGIYYAKKIYADILRKPTHKKNNTLFYLTKNCRALPLDCIQKAIQEEYKDYDEHIIVSPDNSYSSLSGNVRCVRPPLVNIFNEFDTYVYTPVPRHFDCSPRLIAECALFDRKVDYYHIDYFDKGLEVRKKDIEDGRVWLRDDDAIVDIIRNYL